MLSMAADLQKVVPFREPLIEAIRRRPALMENEKLRDRGWRRRLTRWIHFVATAHGSCHTH